MTLSSALSVTSRYTYLLPYNIDSRACMGLLPKCRMIKMNKVAAL